ncbi:MAG: hypothetical protein E6G26_08205 [Actinobacteria bacterium]|nr:MAG: hypothetical protein E6G26_08205 [Actinomycetota bacterium]
MKRLLTTAVLLAAALALAAAGLADPGGKGKGKNKGHNTRFSAQITVTDNGTCGNGWATDTSKRTWSIKPNGNGTFRVGRQDKGTFVTLAGQSPGACDTTGKHGHLVNVGVRGKFRGYLRGTVSGGTFNPNATCNAACIGDTKAFIAAFFPGGTFTCSQGYAGCKFNFEYSSPDKSLVFHHWQDKGTNGVTEQFTGDIANS